LGNNHEMRIESGQSKLGMIKIRLQTRDWQWSSLFSRKNINFNG